MGAKSIPLTCPSAFFKRASREEAEARASVRALKWNGVDPDWNGVDLSLQSTMFHFDKIITFGTEVIGIESRRNRSRQPTTGVGHTPRQSKEGPKPATDHTSATRHGRAKAAEAGDRPHVSHTTRRNKRNQRGDQPKTSARRHLSSTGGAKNGSR